MPIKILFDIIDIHRSKQKIHVCMYVLYMYICIYVYNNIMMKSGRISSKAERYIFLLLFVQRFLVGNDVLLIMLGSETPE